MTPKDILLKILEAIDYSGDKEAFVALFLHLTYRQAILNLAQKLSTDNLTKFTHDLSLNVGDPVRLSNEVAKVLSIYFNEQQKAEVLEATVTKAMADWMQEVVPMLSDVQKQKLAAVAQGVSAPSSSASF